MQILGWLLLAVVMATAAPANAEYKNPMKFTIAIADNNIYADGEIDPDVAMRFATFLKEHNIPDLSFMVLNSPGGDFRCRLRTRKAAARPQVPSRRGGSKSQLA